MRKGKSTGLADIPVLYREIFTRLEGTKLLGGREESLPKCNFCFCFTFFKQESKFIAKPCNPEALRLSWAAVEFLKRLVALEESYSRTDSGGHLVAEVGNAKKNL